MVLKLCSVDTNVLLRLILEDNLEMYQRAVDLITSSATILYVPDLAITEAVYVLEGYGYSRERIVWLIREVMKIPRLDYYEELFSKVFSNYEAHPKLSFNDCYLAELMVDKERVPFYTFDEKLAKQHKAAKLV